ncbi:hypothetical protein [Streptomyces sp. NPDC005283]|uniref:hypothetical protein n=1 Tax=Streptomyces sp. NPDC005283 TaxID=3156871 RepID=UPI0034565556
MTGHAFDEIGPAEGLEHDAGDLADRLQPLEVCAGAESASGAGDQDGAYVRVFFGGVEQLK